VRLRGFRPSACRLFAGAAVAAAMAAAGCTNSTTAPYAYAPYSQTDLIVGTGDGPVASGNTVKVQYTGWFYDPSASDHKGLQFDTSVNGNPLNFIVGQGGVIQCWEKGVPGMKVGGLRRLVCPPSDGYGSARFGSIPPNSTLIFDIELLKIG